MSVAPTSGGASARVPASVAHLFPSKFQFSIAGFDLRQLPIYRWFWVRVLRREGSVRTVLLTAAKYLPLDPR